MFDFLVGATNSFLATLTPDQWDAWRNWLATLGGLIALFVATSTYRRNGKIRREAQARLVYSTLERVRTREVNEIFPLLDSDSVSGAMNAKLKFVRDGEGGSTFEGEAVGRIVQTSVKIYNASKEAIGPVRIRLTYPDRDWAESPGLILDLVPPETSTVVSLIGDTEFPFGTPVLRPRLLFRDSSGMWWNRDGSEPIDLVHNDPENPVATHSHIEPRFISLGTGHNFRHEDEKRVPFSASWHRFWRKRAGKSAIP